MEIPDFISPNYIRLRRDRLERLLLGIVLILDAQNAEARGLVDGRELVEALACSPNPWNEFHIDCTERPGTWTGASAGLGPGRYFFMEIGPT